MAGPGGLEPCRRGHGGPGARHWRLFEYWLPSPLMPGATRLRRSGSPPMGPASLLIRAWQPAELGPQAAAANTRTGRGVSYSWPERSTVTPFQNAMRSLIWAAAGLGSG